jgi:hypothetical protein
MRDDDDQYDPSISVRTRCAVALYFQTFEFERAQNPRMLVDTTKKWASFQTAFSLI